MGAMTDSADSRVWCQWCLGSWRGHIKLTAGHMTHQDLVSFLKRCKAALRDVSGEEGYASPVILVKENVCEDGPNGQPAEFLDPEDSSLTR